MLSQALGLSMDSNRTPEMGVEVDGMIPRAMATLDDMARGVGAGGRRLRLRACCCGAIWTGLRFLHMQDPLVPPAHL